MHLPSQQEVQTTLAEVVRDNSKAEGVHESVMAYISGLATHLINARDFASGTWSKQVPHPIVATVVWRVCHMIGRALLPGVLRHMMSVV